MPSSSIAARLLRRIRLCSGRSSGLGTCASFVTPTKATHRAWTYRRRMLSDDQQSFRDRRLGFGSAADAYHAVRPPSPDEAVDWALEPGNPVDRILDLAAGTGKLTGALINRAAEVIAVEPDSAM